MISETGKALNAKRGPLGLPKAKGFTLIELLIVMSIMVVLTAWAVPSMKGTIKHFQFQCAAEDMQALLSSLQEKAQIERKVIYLDLDMDKNEYTFYTAETADDPKVFSLPAGISMESDEEQVLFLPDGSLKKAVITLSGLDQQAQLVLQGAFGGIQLSYL